MNPVTIKTMPTEGQFVAVWPVGEVVFSQTFMWEDGELMAYDFTKDDWLPESEHGYTAFILNLKSATFVRRMEIV